MSSGNLGEYISEYIWNFLNSLKGLEMVWNFDRGPEKLISDDEYDEITDGDYQDYSDNDPTMIMLIFMSVNMLTFVHEKLCRNIKYKM